MKIICLDTSFSLPVELIPNSVDIITVILKKENKDIKVILISLKLANYFLRWIGFLKPYFIAPAGFEPGQ